MMQSKMKLIPEVYRRYPFTAHNVECYFIHGPEFLVVHVCYASWESYTHFPVKEIRIMPVSKKSRNKFKEEHFNLMYRIHSEKCCHLPNVKTEI